MAQGGPKLSLVAKFDDICRRCLTNTDTAEEELFRDFVRNQEECRRRWHAAIVENAELKNLITSLTSTNTALEQKISNAKEVLQREVLHREKCEEEMQKQRRQLQLIRDFLTNTTDLPNETAEKLSTLVPVDGRKLHDQDGRLHGIDESVGSVLSPSGDSLDDSDEVYSGANSPCLSQGKRRCSIFFKCTSPVTKKPRPSEPADPVSAKGADFKDTMPLGESTRDKAQANGAMYTAVPVTSGKEFVSTSWLVNRLATPSVSALASPLPEAPVLQSPCPPTPTAEAPVPHVPTTSKFTSGSAPSTPVAQRRAHAALGASMSVRSCSAERLTTRQHTFVTKTAFKRDTICGPCSKRIGFYKTILKCSRCQSICHPQCKDQVPLPCIASYDTPKDKLISDYAPSTPPMVPALVVHCIKEVERRGLDAVGIYRVPGAEREVREIREKFQSGKGLPNLSKADIYAVCGALKDFLRSLNETLITKSLWHTFVEATQLDGDDRLWSTWQAVSQLPQANRDTLALLVLHLQTVAAHPEAKMPISNLVRIFAPTVVGFSAGKAAAPSPSMLADVEQQNRVMDGLLTLPREYWTQVVDA